MSPRISRCLHLNLRCVRIHEFDLNFLVVGFQADSIVEL